MREISSGGTLKYRAERGAGSADAAAAAGEEDDASARPGSLPIGNLEPAEQNFVVHPEFRLRPRRIPDGRAQPVQSDSVTLAPGTSFRAIARAPERSTNGRVTMLRVVPRPTSRNPAVEGHQGLWVFEFQPQVGRYL